MKRVWFVAAIVVLVTAAACGGDDDDDGATTSAGKESELVGLFRLTAGECTSAGVQKGSWFRMVQPGGTVEAGAFVQNGDSPCGDKTWTPLTPGSDGGLVTGDYQPNPAAVFDAKGNGSASRLTQPQTWFAVKFSLATNQHDPQSDRDAPAPRIVAAGSQLSGDLSAFAAAWNGQHFNQGAPKPGGQRPGKTAGPTGTYDPNSNVYTLDWSSQIVSGPFNNFTGVWHFEGTFEPKG